MGLYNTITFKNDPSFESVSKEIATWQTKTLGPAALDHYCVKEDGTLTKVKNEWREHTDEELDELTIKKTDGAYTSWQEWKNDDSTTYPLDSWKRTIESTQYEPFYPTGTIEIHKSYRGVYHSYDVRFDGCSFECVELNEAKKLHTQTNE